MKCVGFARQRSLQFSFVDNFISEDDLKTFEGFLRYQAIDGASHTPEELASWRQIFEEGRRRAAAVPKVGRMKLVPTPGEQKYAVAIQDDSELWLTMWVRYSRKGEVFIMYPRGDREWEAHASYHLDGTFHQKSYGSVIQRVQRQPLKGVFNGAESLGMYAGHGGKSIGAVCDPSVFTGVVTVPLGILGPRHGFVAVDLVEPGSAGNVEPLYGANTYSRQVFECTGRPSVVITVGQFTH
jgi:hypothetical protein